MADEATSSGAQIIREFLPSSRFVGHLGIELVDIKPRAAVLRMPFADSNTTIATVVHGGAISSLIDTAAMVAAWSDAEAPENLRGTTVGLTVNFLAPATAADLTAHAEVIRQGRSLTHVEVDVSTPDGTHVAKGLVTYKIG